MPAYEWPQDVRIEAEIRQEEAYRQEYQWDCNEVQLAAAGAPGNLGGVVPGGMRRRIREITIRHTGTDNTVITVMVGGIIRLSIDVAPQSTRVWSSQDGIHFAAGQQPTVQTSDVTGGGAYLSARGIEAPEA